MAKLLQHLTSLILAGLVAVTVLWLVLAVAAQTNGGSFTVEGTIDRGFVPPQAAEPLLTSADGQTFSIGPTFAGTNGDVTVEQINVTANFTEPTLAQTALVTGSGLIWLLIIFGVMWQLRALLASASLGGPFTDHAPQRVRWIGVLILGTGLADLVTPLVRQAVVSSHDIGVAVSSAGVAWGSLAFRVGVGLTVLVIAEAFAHGVHLRKLEESVV